MTLTLLVLTPHFEQKRTPLALLHLIPEKLPGTCCPSIHSGASVAISTMYHNESLYVLSTRCEPPETGDRTYHACFTGRALKHSIHPAKKSFKHLPFTGMVLNSKNARKNEIGFQASGILQSNGKEKQINIK